MERRTGCILAVALLLLFAGCLGGSTGDDAGNDSEWCHGLLQAEEPFRNVTDPVQVSNDVVQSTEPIRTIVEHYRENGTAQGMGVWNESAKATDRALTSLPPEGRSGVHVRLRDGRFVSVGMGVNGSLCGGPL